MRVAGRELAVGGVGVASVVCTGLECLLSPPGGVRAPYAVCAGLDSGLRVRRRNLRPLL